MINSNQITVTQEAKINHTRVFDKNLTFMILVRLVSLLVVEAVVVGLLDAGYGQLLERVQVLVVGVDQGILQLRLDQLEGRRVVRVRYHVH